MGDKLAAGRRKNKIKSLELILLSRNITRNFAGNMRDNKIIILLSCPFPVNLPVYCGGGDMPKSVEK